MLLNTNPCLPRHDPDAAGMSEASRKSVHAATEALIHLRACLKPGDIPDGFEAALVERCEALVSIIRQMQAEATQVRYERGAAARARVAEIMREFPKHQIPPVRGYISDPL